MKVLFILPDFNYLDFMTDYSGFNNIGLAYLSACLKQAGHQTGLIHLIKEIPVGELIKKIRTINPNLICYTSYTNQFHYIKEVASIVKKEFNIPIICGGVHATVHPEDVLGVDGIDMICIGEGEKAIVELVEKLERKQDFSRIKSLWVKKDGKIIKNEINDLNQDLDSLPFPDRELFDFKNLSGTKLGTLNVLATRGCPFQCSYCINHQLQNIYKGKGRYVRFRSVSKIVKEVKEVKERYPEIKYLEFLDDCFCLDKSWVKDFVKEYKKEQVDLPIVVNTRVDMLNEDVLKELKDVGAKELALGVEVGNEKLRTKVLNKHISNSQIIKVLKLCKDYGFIVRCYIMLGVPFETMENILETVKLCAEMQPNYLHIAVFQPYPNTVLYNTCLKHGFLDRSISFKEYLFFNTPVINQDSITKREVIFAFKFFRVFVRLYERVHNKHAIKLLDRTFLSTRLHTPFRALYPLIYALVFPVEAPYRLLLITSPKLARFLKGKVKYTFKEGKK